MQTPESMSEQPPEVRRLAAKARGRQAFYYQDRKIYEWEQDIDEVHIYIEPPPGIFFQLIEVEEEQDVEKEDG